MKLNISVRSYKTKIPTINSRLHKCHTKQNSYYIVYNYRFKF